jgi:glutathione S-transferase
VSSNWLQIARSDGEKRDQLVKDFVAVVKKEIEPLLKDAKPFFGASEKITLVEVCNTKYYYLDQRANKIQAITAPFLLRIFTFAKHGILPESLVYELNNLPNFSKWVGEVIKHDSVLGIWDAERQLDLAKKRFAKLHGESK